MADRRARTLCYKKYPIICFTGPKSPGLIVLEHELSEQSVGAFISAYPVIKANGWKTQSTARILDGNAYRNSSADPANIVFSNSTNTISSVSKATTSQSACVLIQQAILHRLIPISSPISSQTTGSRNPATSQPSSATSLWAHQYLRWALAAFCCVSMTL